MTLDAFLQAIVDVPHSAATTWLVLADWLEDQGDPRSELVRLLYQPDYRQDLPAVQRDERVRELLASGVGPVAPTLVNSIGMKLALVPRGVFSMGSAADEGDDNEHPQHEVEITRPFFMGTCQVTQEEYQRVMGNNPSYFSASGSGKKNVEKLDTRRFPVECVSQDEVIEFCRKLSELPVEKQAGRTYRLPTEAEWEYACRGGAASYTRFHSGKALASSQANFNASGLGRTCPVGSYPANAFGLFDMHGNVWEWCLDWFDPSYYKSSPRQDPQGPKTGDARVLRGGSWFDLAGFCRAAFRRRNGPDYRYGDVGCRVCFCLD